MNEVFEQAGCRGFVHAITLDGRHEIGHGPDDAVVPASVVKVLLAIEVETQMAERRLDPRERLLLTESDRTPGPGGLSLFRDDAEVSLRDLVTLMLTISDNVATDVLISRVGLDAVNGTAARLGLPATRVGTALRPMIESIAQDAGFADWAALQHWRPADRHEQSAVQTRLAAARALQPDAPTRTTARDMTTMLRLIWTDEAGPAQACARVRELMARQLTRHRLAAGFGREANVAAKSGGLMGVVSNEIGVVSFPDGDACAVAVFTRTENLVDERAVNAAIGEAAALAVAELRP